MQTLPRCRYYGHSVALGRDRDARLPSPRKTQYVRELSWTGRGTNFYYNRSRQAPTEEWLCSFWYGRAGTMQEFIFTHLTWLAGIYSQWRLFTVNDSEFFFFRDASSLKVPSALLPCCRGVHSDRRPNFRLLLQTEANVWKEWNHASGRCKFSQLRGARVFPRRIREEKASQEEMLLLYKPLILSTSERRARKPLTTWYPSVKDYSVRWKLTPPKMNK